MIQDSKINSTRNSRSQTGTGKFNKVWINLSPSELIEHAILAGEGYLTDTGALMADTGEFTGRSPKARFIVLDKKTKDTVWWNDINLPFSPEQFDALHQKMLDFLQNKTVYARDAYAGADPDHRLSLRIFTTLAWHNLFCYNMFLRPEKEQLEHFTPSFTVICAPEFMADPNLDGTRSKNFAIINLTQNIILIGGTGYAGEIKKGVFSVLNYTVPNEKKILSMHCSSNIGEKGDTAIFFGLSGTGKTTLSAAPDRKLIGDDEHGWTDTSVFNFEGGCYAKTIHLSRKKEPEIWDAIKYGAILENTRFFPGSRTVDFENDSITENTRTAYPIGHIKNIALPSIGDIPKNIFFLTADAFGVIPPISKLTASQAMYHFISGYTAKVAGTEVGISEPQATFSACFGAAFLPLHPIQYAELFGEKMEKQHVHVWLVNTGWTGGPFGVGKRMDLQYTRAMISAALNGELENIDYLAHHIFKIKVPTSCPGVPKELLNPRDTWKDKAGYDAKARELAHAFSVNFEKYKDKASSSVLAGAPNVGKD